MKVFFGVLIFVCLAFPVFSQSQSPNADLFAALGESMDGSVSRSTSVLADYDSRNNNNDDFRMYSDFKKRYEDLLRAIRSSEARMSLLYRTNERADFVRRERDNYDELLTQLQSMKGEYDSWLRTVQ